ncbi:hypothetical protein ACQKWADRAFT_280777 [Trichoderma austrokoningii]
MRTHPFVDFCSAFALLSRSLWGALLGHNSHRQLQASSEAQGRHLNRVRRKTPAKVILLLRTSSYQIDLAVLLPTVVPLADKRQRLPAVTGAEPLQLLH